MTDKLRQAAEMALEALEWRFSNADEAIDALRQALEEPDTGIDRGAWSDVPDATKWVDELRGDDESPNSTTDVVEPETEKPLTLKEEREAQQQLETHLDAVYKRNNQAFLAQAQLGQSESNQPQELFGKTERLEAENKRLQELADYRLKLLTKMPSEWLSLTDEDIAQAVGSPLDEVYLADFRKVEAKLKEKNYA